MEQVSAYEKMKALRSDRAHSVSDIPFKKTMLGGFRQREVEEYIQSLKNNMQMAEKAYNEKIEEYATASNLLLQERDSLRQKIKECEKELRILQAANLEITQREEEAARQSQKETGEALALVEDLRQQIANNEQSEEAAKEIESLREKNKMLTAKSYELEETKNKLNMDCAALSDELNKITNYNEKLLAEIDDLKKNINGLKIAKRNHIMNTNMLVYEYRKGHESNMESLLNSLNDIGTVIGDMKNHVLNLSQKTRTYLNEEDLEDQ